VASAGCREAATREAPATSDDSRGPGADPASSDATGTATAAGTPEEGPIARVNGEPVSRERFERELAQARHRYERARKEMAPEVVDRLRRMLVRRLVESKVIRQKAEAWDVAPSEDELDAMWSEHRERFGTDDAFRAFLERSGTTEADLKNQFVDNLLMDRIKQRIDDRLEIPAEAVRAYYDARLEHFDQPEEVRVAQILIGVPPGSSAEQKADRNRRAKEALEELRDGADFGSLAQDVSTGPARFRAGDLGYLPRGRLVSAVEEAAFRLKPGQLSDVIETRFGFHIIKVLDHRPARRESFEDARPRIERRMRSQRLRKAVHEAIERWKREMDIELYEPTDLATASPSQREAPGPRPGGSRIPIEMTPKGQEPENPGLDLESLPGGFRPVRPDRSKGAD